MKARTIGISLLTLAFAGTALAQDTAKPAKAPAPAAAKEKPATKAVHVALETSMGKIVLELNAEKAPITVKNFLNYVESKAYDGTIFHRVINGFMIQGGGFELVEGQGTQKKTMDPIKNEAVKSGLKNDIYTVAMARTNAPHTATNQFFINVKANTSLNPGGFSPDGYAVFGKVIEGKEVVDKIKAVPTGVSKLKSRLPDGSLLEQPMRDVPTAPVIIKTARVVKK